jgi:hypothetical protein
MAKQTRPATLDDVAQLLDDLIAEITPIRIYVTVAFWVWMVAVSVGIVAVVVVFLFR